jgi:hypothetical protein
MPEYEIRVNGTLGPFAMSMCPGFSVRRSVSLRGVADGEEAMLRTLGAILDRQLTGIEMRIRERGPADPHHRAPDPVDPPDAGHRTAARSREERLARSKDDRQA